MVRTFAAAAFRRASIAVLCAFVCSFGRIRTGGLHFPVLYWYLMKRLLCFLSVLVFLALAPLAAESCFALYFNADRTRIRTVIIYNETGLPLSLSLNGECVWEHSGSVSSGTAGAFASGGGGSVPGDTRVAADTRVPGGGTALDSGTAPDSESTAVLVPGDLISLRRNFSMGDCITIASESDGVSLGMSSDRDSVYVYAREGLDKGRISAEN